MYTPIQYLYDLEELEQINIIKDYSLCQDSVCGSPLKQMIITS